MLNTLKSNLKKVVRPPTGPDTSVHYLHIGKAAGTQIKHLCDVMQSENANLDFTFHQHDEYLRDLADDARYFFSIRQPVSRFKSGFYSRKRKGAPRYFYEWSAHEAQAFDTFEHANELAEALSDTGALGQSARNAMESIRHTSQMQHRWFEMRGYFLEIQPPIAIIRQEHFNTDMAQFASRLGVQLPPIAPPGKKSAHANSYDAVPKLSDKAVANLKQWYAKDEAFYAQCEAWIEAAPAS